jgi:hypothetical protein
MREKWRSEIECPYAQLQWLTLNKALNIQYLPQNNFFFFFQFYISFKMFSLI